APSSFGQIDALKHELEELEKDPEPIRQRFKLLKRELIRSGAEFLPIKAKILEKQKLVEQRRDRIRQQIEQHRKAINDTVKAGLSMPGQAFWTQSDPLLQIASPWSCPGFDKARDELFASSFRLHRAFIDAAAKPLRHNLATLFKGLSSGFTGAGEDMRQSIWASLFLVVPVLSTTFASFGRQFSSLGREQLGWLMIDEAGQATPQAALGAIWRSKRAVIIGDPLQIEPVTSLPDRLTAAIFKHFDVSHEAWAAPWASAQVLADRASWLGTNFEQNNQSIWVGCPLRVHRRCDEPMFSISNDIAYSGLMVHATPVTPSPIGGVCGESSWIDIAETSAGKWNRTEGEVAIHMLQRALASGVSPDVFIISPFRQVAINMWRLAGERFAPEASSWFRDRMGTVHTFQGKEAEAVIFILGAGGSDSVGARRWAGSKVNLLNVAVTRAKRRLYVIGNRNAWAKVPFFSDLADTLRVQEYGTSSRKPREI
nr:AAA domain-containing protein [Pseudomonadota bacterium]